MSISAKAIDQILSARGMTRSDIARRSGIAIGDLTAAVEGDRPLPDDSVVSLADELAVPVSALFSERKLDLLPSVDFRSPTPSVARFAKGTLRAFEFVERISSTLGQLDLTPRLSSEANAVAPLLDRTNARQLARIWRRKWGYTADQQLTDGDANKVYTSLRSFIEGLGVVVVHYQFETDEAAGLYAQIDGGPHTIVVNTTKSSKARKLFTLAHEFCHLLLRKEGASNPSFVRNSVERFCNRFAAYLLAPAKLIQSGLMRYRYQPSSDNNFIRLFAKNLGISQEALFLRLVELDYLTDAQYGAWKAQFEGQTPTGDQGERGGRSDPLQNKRTQYGTSLLRALEKALRRDQLDEIDIYRLVGLKPKYQAQLFGEA